MAIRRAKTGNHSVPLGWHRLYLDDVEQLLSVMRGDYTSDLSYASEPTVTIVARNKQLDGASDLAGNLRWWERRRLEIQRTGPVYACLRLYGGGANLYLSDDSPGHRELTSAVRAALPHGRNPLALLNHFGVYLVGPLLFATALIARAFWSSEGLTLLVAYLGVLAVLSLLWAVGILFGLDHRGGVVVHSVTAAEAQASRRTHRREWIFLVAGAVGTELIHFLVERL